MFSATADALPLQPLPPWSALGRGCHPVKDVPAVWCFSPSALWTTSCINWLGGSSICQLRPLGGTRSADVFGHSFLYFYSSQRHGIGLRPMTLARPPIRSQIDGVFASRGCAAGGPGIRTDLVFRRDSGEKAWAPSTRSITDFKSSWPPFRRGPFLECLPVVSSL